MFRRLVRRNGGSQTAFTAVLILIPLLFLFGLLLSAEKSGSPGATMTMDSRLAEINDHLDHLKLLDKEKSKAFMELKHQVQFLMSVSSGKDSDNGISVLLGNLSKSSANATNHQRAFLLAAAARNGLLANLSISGMELAVPNLYDHLPHLLNRPAGLTPVVKLANRNRRGLHTVIGIPTIRRPKVSYLVTTLRSLLENLSPEDRKGLTTNYVTLLIKPEDQ